MTELLKLVLHDFWSFAGTVVLLTLSGAFACEISANIATAIGGRRP